MNKKIKTILNRTGSASVKDLLELADVVMEDIEEIFYECPGLKEPDARLIADWYVELHHQVEF